jgi:hypothetical protein
MPNLDILTEATEARPELAAWMRATSGAEPQPGVQLADAFCAWVRDRFHLDLRTNWNPSACVFEARWQDRGRSAEGLERPFSAETVDDARLLACAGLLRLINSIGAPPTHGGS